MNAPWKMLHKPKMIDVISPEGEVRCRVAAYGTGNPLVVDDVKTADIRVGDEIRLPLPNGRDEAFTVIDPKYYDSNSIFPPHYQIQIKRKDIYEHNKGGFYNIKLHGDGSRINIGSTDNSVNISNKADTFSEIKKEIQKFEIDSDVKEKLLESIDGMRDAKTQEQFGSYYHRFIASAANHMTIITPFLPSLTNFLSNMAN